LKAIKDIFCPAGKIYCTHLKWNPASGKDMPECAAHNLEVDIALYEKCHWPSRQDQIKTNYEEAYERLTLKIQDPMYNTRGYMDYKRALYETLEDCGFELKELKKEES